MNESISNTEENRLIIKLYGDDFHGQIDSQVAEAIVCLQSRINRIARHAFFGSTEDRHRMSPEQRSSIALVFEVRPGCSELIADILSVFEPIFHAVAKDMTPEDLLQLVELLCKSLLGAYGISKTYELLNEKLIGKEGRVSEHVLDRIKSLFEVAHKEMSEAKRDTAKAFPKATDMTWGKERFDKDQLNELRSPTQKSSCTTGQETANYIVLRIAVDQRPTITVTLCREDQQGIVFKATYVEDGDMFGPDCRTIAIMNAASEGSPVSLRIEVKKDPNGEIVRATIMDTP